MHGRKGVFPTANLRQCSNCQSQPYRNYATMKDAPKSLALTKKSPSTSVIKRPVGKPKRGPVMHNPKASEVLDWLASGGTLLEFAKRKGNPEVRTIHLWKEEDEEFAALYKVARDKGQEAMLEECKTLCDTEPTDAVQAAWRRLQVDTRMKCLRMWNPARWAERVDMNHSGGISLMVATGVPER